MFLYERLASRSWATNGVLGVLAILLGTAIFAWPQLALLILAGTLGLNLILLGGYLVWTAAEQKRLEDLHVRGSYGPNVRRVVRPEEGAPFGSVFVRRVFRG